MRYLQNWNSTKSGEWDTLTCPVRWWSRPACVPTGTCSRCWFWFWNKNFFSCHFRKTTSGKCGVCCGWLLCQGGLPALSAGWAGQPVSLLGHVHAFVLDFEIKFFRYSLPWELLREDLSQMSLRARIKGEEVDNSSSYFIMLKGFYNDININKCGKVIQYLRESSWLSAIRRATDFKREVRRVIRALVVPKRKYFHLDLTSGLNIRHRAGGGGANIAQNLRKNFK